MYFLYIPPRYKARQRVSAKAALAHPYFNREGLLGLSVMQNLRLLLFRATQKDYSEAAKWVTGLMARSGTESVGGFTEAQLQQLRVCIPYHSTYLTIFNMNNIVPSLTSGSGTIVLP